MFVDLDSDGWIVWLEGCCVESTSRRGGWLALLFQLDFLFSFLSWVRGWGCKGFEFIFTNDACFILSRDS